jgi:ribonuclease HII
MSEYIVGIDEAARGPVVGPLIICTAYCKRSEEKKLKKIVKSDSKNYSAKQREEIYSLLKRFCSFRWVEITAKQLNEMMKDMSLNDIEAKAMAELAKKIDGDVMIDMIDRYSWTFRKRMEKFGVKKFEAEHKADEKYPIVGAASICAKIIRDQKVQEIKDKLGVDFGSGYPGDSKTLSALKDKETMKKLKPYIRQRWKTIDNLKQRKLFEED